MRKALLTFVLAVCAGCAGADVDSEDAEDADEDDADGEIVESQASAISTSCRDNEQRFSFDRGKEIVCWHKFPSLGGTVKYRYRFLNNTGRTWRKKIALDNMPDTGCKSVGPRKWATYGPYVNYRWAGKPQHVRGC